MWQNNRKKLADYLHHLHDEFADGETAFKLIWRAIRGRSQLGNVVNEFKAATLPDRVLEQLEPRDTLESEHEIFVEASKAFEDGHGHSAAEFAWGHLDIDAIEARDVTSLLEKLFDLRNSSAGMR